MHGEMEGMSEEQAADFRALEAAAMGGDLPPGVEPEAAAPDPAEQWAMIPAMIGSALGMALPDLKEVYSESACRAWGAAMVPVADKYGWNADTLMGPEVGLLCASLPLVVGTLGAVNRAKAQAVAAHRAAQAKAPAVAAPDLGKTVHAGTVAFGEPVPA